MARWFGKKLCERPWPAFVLLFFFRTYAAYATDFYDIPRLPPPEEYGNILISRISESNGIRPVAFSHWSHRIKYTCRVCHTELEFELKTNSTEVTEKANQEGKFCGACHNGKMAFGHTKEHCDKCHNDNIGYGKEQFTKLNELPFAPFGNKIDWMAALNRAAINPKNTITGNYQPMPYNKTVVLELEWGSLPPAVFPHRSHTAWLDCSNCHPDIFNIKKRTTKHFAMERILKAEFCGACHLRMAFPLNDCKRCHHDKR